MNRLSIGIFAGLLVAYPVLVYFGRDRLSPAAFGLLLMLLITARVLLGRRSSQQLALGGVILAYCLLVAWSDSPFLLRLYPMLVSIMVAAGFLYSLRTEESLIERFARSGGKEITAVRSYYMRRLTLCWGIIIAANGLIAAYTACCTSLAFWALYNGALSYAAMAVFFAAEFVFRHFYRKRVGSP